MLLRQAIEGPRGGIKGWLSGIRSRIPRAFHHPPTFTAVFLPDRFSVKEAVSGEKAARPVVKFWKGLLVGPLQKYTYYSVKEGDVRCWL